MVFCEIKVLPLRIEDGDFHGFFQGLVDISLETPRSISRIILYIGQIIEANLSPSLG